LAISLEHQLKRHLAFSLLQSFTTEPLCALYDFDQKKYFYFEAKSSHGLAYFYDHDSQHYLVKRGGNTSMVFMKDNEAVAIFVKLNNALMLRGFDGYSNQSFAGAIRQKTLSIYDSKRKRYSSFAAK
jgi:hypothetical protein